jgi:hypothetical protein
MDNMMARRFKKRGEGDARQKRIKISYRDLGEEKKKYGSGDESGNEESFQRSLSLPRKKSLEIDDPYKTC